MTDLGHFATHLCLHARRRPAKQDRGLTLWRRADCTAGSGRGASAGYPPSSGSRCLRRPSGRAQSWRLRPRRPVTFRPARRADPDRLDASLADSKVLKRSDRPARINLEARAGSPSRARRACDDNFAVEVMPPPNHAHPVTSTAWSKQGPPVGGGEPGELSRTKTYEFLLVLVPMKIRAARPALIPACGGVADEMTNAISNDQSWKSAMSPDVVSSQTGIRS